MRTSGALHDSIDAPGRFCHARPVNAAFISETGPPSVIQYGPLPEREPGPTELRVRVRAVSVNPIDTYIRSGAIAMDLPFPFILGCDFAGEVAAVGAAVSRFREGDRVWGSNQGLLGRQGTFAETIVVDEQWAYGTPEKVADESVAATALVGVTAHLGLFREARLKAGETLFVTGGSGGVGSVVVQMAKRTGATVVTTAGSAAKADLCRELGADHVIPYKTEDLSAGIAAAAPDGVDVWWDTVREPDFDLAVSRMAERGRMILMAGREARPEFPVGPFYVKGCSLHGFVMFTAAPDEQRRCAEDINHWLSDGTLKPRIDRVMPLSEAGTAHQLQEDNTLRGAGTLSGKLVLKP